MGPGIFLKGLLAGLVVCAPVGPIGLLCVRRTLMHGRMVGLLSLLGASTADGPHHVVILNRISGMILMGFGIGAGLMGIMR